MARTQNKPKDQTKAQAHKEQTAPEKAQGIQEGTTTEIKAQGIQEGTTTEIKAQGSQEGTIPDGVVVNHPAGLNLRDGPGISFNVLDALPDGAQLTVLLLPEGAEVPGYALVRYEGSEDGPLVGWVNTDYVRED